jgi:hypothetical protein
MTISTPPNLLQYLRYEDAVKSSVETLWDYWLTDGMIAREILKVIVQAYKKYRDSNAGLRESFGSIIEHDLRLVFSNSRCDRNVKSGILEVCSGELAKAFATNDHTVNGEFTGFDGNQQPYFDIMASILDHDLESAFIQPKIGDQCYSLFLAGQGLTYLFKDLLRRCDHSEGSEAQLLNCLAARDAQGKHTSLTLAVVGGYTSIVEVILASWKVSEIESEQLYKTEFLIGNLSASNNVQILAMLLKSNLNFDRSQLFEKILFSYRAGMLLCFLEAQDMNTNKQLFSDSIVSKMMQHDDPKAWSTCCTYWRSKSPDKTFCRHIFGERRHSLLHYAIRLRRHDVVRDLLDDHPELAGHLDDKQRYPLWYLLNRDTEMPTSPDNSHLEEIRQAIVHTLIRENENWEVDSIVQCSQPPESGPGVANHGLLCKFR